MLPVVGFLLTVIVTPAFAQAFIGVGEAPLANISQFSDNGHSTFARGLLRAKRLLHARQKNRADVGIFENLPLGVTDPYAYHNQLMQED
jgi:hypothetical protein